MSGVRVACIPMEATERDLTVWFSNPNHGGGKITSIHYPLFDNDAVIIFQEIHTAETVQRCEHKICDKDIFLRRLPQFQVFRKLEAEVEPAVSSFLELSVDARDEIMHHAGLNYRFDYKTNMSYLTGTWYQLEWAWKFIGGFMLQQKKALTKSAYNKGFPNLLDKRSVGGLGDETDAVANNRLRASELENKAHTSNDGSIQLKKGTTKILGDNVTISIPGADQSEEPGSLMISEQERAGMNETAGFEAVVAAEMKVDRRANNEERALSEQDSFQYSNGKSRVSRSLSVEERDSRTLHSLEFSYEGLKVSLYTGDITLAETDAIVNVGLNSRRGVCSAITLAAGPLLSSEIQDHFTTHGDLETGDVMHTSAGGMLHKHVRYVLHTVGPLWNEEMPSDVGAYQLLQTFLNCLKYADKLRLSSVVFPAISTGTYRGSLDICAKCFLDAILLFTYKKKGNHSLKEIHLVNNHEDSTANMVLAVRQLRKKGMDLLTVEALEETERMNTKMKKKPGLFAKVRAKVTDFLGSPSKDEVVASPSNRTTGGQRNAVIIRPPTSSRPLPKPQHQAKGISSRK